MRYLESIGALVLCGATAVPAPALEAVRNLTLPDNRDRILQIEGDRWTRLAVHHAIEGAFRRLASTNCQMVLLDFTGRAGRSLRQNLEVSGYSASDYLGALRYADGAKHSPCAKAGILAFTEVGSRIVYICARFREQFLSLRKELREELELALIHEVLHTLGLGENPPTPREISDQVRFRCAGR